MKRPSLFAALLTPLLTAALLSGCTGTNEPQVSTRAALINAGGAELRAVTPADAATARPLASVSQSVTGALDLAVLPGGSQLIVAFPDRLELRGAALATVRTLPLPAGFTPCFVRLSASAAGDTLAALSACPGGASQTLLVYRSDGTLLYSATLPPPTPLDSTQTRFAVLPSQAVWVARPATGGGTELLRADSSGIQLVTPPPLSAVVSDLAVRGGLLYAATDSGVRQVALQDGSLAQTPALSGAYTRLYGGGNLLAAWLGNAGAQPLTVWDGSRVGSPGLVSDLRGVAFAPDGNVYFLSSTALSVADTVFGLSQGSWKTAQVQGNLQDARALTWLTAN